MKKIINIVIYKSIKSGEIEKKSCIFYDDGSTKETTFEEGIVATKEVLQERSLSSKDLKDMMNNDTFYTLSEKDFRENYNNFLPQTTISALDEKVEYDAEKFDEAIKKLESIGKEKKEEKIVLIPVPKENEVIEEGIDEDDEEEYEFADEEKDEEEIVEETEDQEENYSSYESFEEVEIEEEDEDAKDVGTVLKIAAGVVAVGLIGLTVYSLTRCSKLGKVLTDESIETTTTTIDNDIEENNDTKIHEVTLELNNDLYNDYMFIELLDVTNNDFQKTSMINLDSSLTGFNNIFAKNYLESGTDIKAALSFDEVVALQQAYNNYSVDEIRAYFNGHEVDAVYMSNAYKSASLQLMGAYTIETSKNPVDMSILIDSAEGRDFYNRYHAMYLAAKEAKGEEQIRLVKEFYAAVEKDFPISEEVRTNGISHSEDHNSLKDYQLAVVPMIASAEMIFQNLDIDYTLDNEKIDFINDIGLCNHADDKFERIETIMLGAYEDKTNPTFDQYKNAIIAKLVKDNSYVIDDAHRELSNLRRFQEVVNHDALWKHRTTYTGVYGEAYTTSYGETTLEWEESETTYEVGGVEIEEKEIPEDEKKKVDDSISQENEEARRRAEAAAQAEAERQQREADENAKAIEDEIEKDNEQLQNDINDINKEIENGGTPNENNYNNIDFDDEHSNNNGDLDSSVKNITTDGNGADEDLPDPNVYGQDFDSRVSATYFTTVYDSDDSYVEWAGVDGAYTEYDYDYVAYDEDGNPITVEEGQHYTR
jgi:hypothetical protein